MFRFWLARNNRTPFSVQTLLFFALFVGITRGMLEHFFFGIDTNGSDVLGFVPFYFSLPFVYGFLMAFLPQVKYERALQAVTFASLLGLLPPIIDFMASNDKTHSIFYGYYLTHDYSSFPWFGFAPDKNYPLGEAITIWITFFLVTLFVYKSTRSYLRAGFGVIIGYVAFLVYSLVLPGLLSLVMFGHVPNSSHLQAQPLPKLRLALFMLGIFQVVCAWFLDAYTGKILWYYARRLLHFLPFFLLTFLGATLSNSEQIPMAIAALVTFVSGIAIIAQNDFLSSSRTNHSHRRAVDLANAVAIVTYTMVLFSGYKLALLGIACFSLSVLYHYDFFHIRGSLLGSMKVEGMWGLLTYLTGVFAGSLHYPHAKTIILGGLVFGGFALFSMLKDAKDLRADHKARRNTIYTYLYRQNFRIGRFQSIMAYAGAILIAIAGIAYFPPTTPALWVHLGFAAASFPIIRSIHRKLYFQIFLFAISAIILNLIFFEGMIFHGRV